MGFYPCVAVIFLSSTDFFVVGGEMLLTFPLDYEAFYSSLKTVKNMFAVYRVLIVCKACF